MRCNMSAKGPPEGQKINIFIYFFGRSVIHDMSHDRDDTNLAQFKSRAKQPKIIAAPGIPLDPTPINIFLVHDSPFGGCLDQIDDTRFKYMGAPNTLASICGNKRKIDHACMGSSFNG